MVIISCIWISQVTQGTVVKLDIIAKIDNRYVEVTNFFLIVQRDKMGNNIVLSEKFGDYGTSLIYDINKYHKINILKSIKRLFGCI